MTLGQKGMSFALAAISVFAVQDGISKHLASLYPPVFVVMIRYWVFAAFVIVIACNSAGGLKAAALSRRPTFQILRSLLLVVQILVSITSFARVGLAQTQAILQSTPLLVTMLSIPLLGELVGWRRWLAVIAGFAGVALILKPDAEAFDGGLFLPLSGALIFAFYVIVTRLVSRTDAAMTSFFYTGVIGALALSIIGPFYWSSLAPFDWLWMGLLCVTGTSGHYFLIRAYDILDAVTVQPLMYLQLVFACIMGVAVFNETLSLHMVTGSCIVVGAGMFTVWREQMIARRRDLT
jgi:drug/metabolite transporter (DMT)-like permease